MESNQEGRRGQSAVFSFFNIRRGAKAAGGGGVNVSMRAALIALLAAALAFAGCNGEDSEDYVIENPLPVDSLIISPDKASVVTGSSQSFTAMSGNSKVDWTEVNWEIEGTENHDTDFDENGTLHIAENETEKTLTIVASLKSDQGKTSTAAVTIILPANSFSNAATGEINSAIDMIRAAKQSAQSSVTIALSPGPETVNLTANEDIGTTGLVLTATGDSPNSPAEVEIDGRGRTVQLAADSNNGSVITVGSGVTLTLRNITFKGKAGNNAPLVRVKDGGKLILEDGAKITGNTRTGGDQKANVDNGPEYNESTYGGGGGIVVHNGGSLEMSGTSEISGNTAGSVGGGVLVYGTDSKVTMTGSSKISANIANGVAGGGVYLSDGGALSMSENASITDNNINKIIDSGDQYGNGGGVLAIRNSSIEMHGFSKIRNNTSSGRGGGVAIGSDSSLTMDGSSEVCNNTISYWGGGIYMFGSNVTVTMSENAGIKRNKAGDGGGGVSASNDNSNDRTFTMKGGFISNNEAENFSAGGVDICKITFNMTSGVISGNETATEGGGVAVDGTFNMTGGVIYGSTAPSDDLKNTATKGGAAVYVNDENKSEDTIYQYQWTPPVPE